MDVGSSWHCLCPGKLKYMNDASRNTLLVRVCTFTWVRKSISTSTFTKILFYKIYLFFNQCVNFCTQTNCALVPSFHPVCAKDFLSIWKHCCSACCCQNQHCLNAYFQTLLILTIYIFKKILGTNTVKRLCQKWQQCFCICMLKYL